MSAPDGLIAACLVLTAATFVLLFVAGRDD